MTRKIHKTLWNGLQNTEHEFERKNLSTHTCTDCFFSVRSASVVPRRRRRGRERAPKNGTKGSTRIFYLFLRSSLIRTPSPGHPALGRTLVRRHTVGDTILSTDTCRSTSVSLCLSPSSRSLCVRAPPSLSSPLSFSLYFAYSTVPFSHYYPRPASHPSHRVFSIRREECKRSRDGRRLYYAYSPPCTHHLKRDAPPRSGFDDQEQ